MILAAATYLEVEMSWLFRPLQMTAESRLPVLRAWWVVGPEEACAAPVAIVKVPAALAVETESADDVK